MFIGLLLLLFSFVSFGQIINPISKDSIIVDDSFFENKFLFPDSLYFPDSIYNQAAIMQDIWLQILDDNNESLVDNVARPPDTLILQDSILSLKTIISNLFPAKTSWQNSVFSENNQTLFLRSPIIEDSSLFAKVETMGLPDTINIGDTIVSSKELFVLLFREAKNSSLSLLKPILLSNNKKLPDTFVLENMRYAPKDLAINLFEISEDAPLDALKDSQNPKQEKSDKMLETMVNRDADSIDFDMINRKGYLYGNGVVEYGDITLKADYIEIDFAKSEVFAKGVPDSTGKFVGTPIFSQGGEEYEAEEMRYNFQTKKGLIYGVITQDGEGYLHGDKIKKLGDGTMNASSGSFTTCSLKHPHYEFRFKKAKVIPGEKVVTGPAYFVVADVPTPLFIPFGIFPSQKKHHSGLIFPGFGESASRGYFLENIGYYWVISDKVDFQVTGDAYTLGSWAVDPVLRYKSRYKHRGNLALGYGRNVTGIEATSSYSDVQDFKVLWTHQQDPKANPNSNFSANVNIYSNSYNKYNPTSTNNYLSNTFSSSIAYQRNWGSALFLTANATHTQNTRDNTMSISLPRLSLTTAQWNPFRKKMQQGSLKWYENINVKYTMNADNRLKGLDSLIFKGNIADNLQYGMKHSIPISSSVKALKFFTWTNSVSYNEYWYGNSIRKHYQDSIVGVVTDTIDGFASARDFSLSSTMSTKLYGMFAMKGDGPIKAVRHVLTPSVGISYRPDFSDPLWGFYGSYYDPSRDEIIDYSKFSEGIYGGPAGGKSGNLNFSLGNNLEMKVRSASDTVTGTKKIKLIERLNISMSYNMAADSLNWSDLSMSGNTTIFKGLSVNYRSSWSPYVKNGNNQKINKTVWDVEKKLFIKNSANWALTFNYGLNNDTFKGEEKKEEEKAYPQEMQNSRFFDDPEAYVDWNIPWSLNLNYSFSFTDKNIYTFNQYVSEQRIVQTLGFNGNFSVTKNWKVTFNSGYDFEMNKLSYTNVNIIRDLHCWQMSFNWVPFGARQQWSFKINIKASMLKDLKYEKKRDFRDYY